MPTAEVMPYPSDPGVQRRRIDQVEHQHITNLFVSAVTPPLSETLLPTAYPHPHLQQSYCECCTQRTMRLQPPANQRNNGGTKAEGESPSGDRFRSEEDVRIELDTLYRKTHILEGRRTGATENPSLLAAWRDELLRMKNDDQNMRQHLTLGMIAAKSMSRLTVPTEEVQAEKKKVAEAHRLEKGLEGSYGCVDELHRRGLDARDDIEMRRRQIGGVNAEKEQVDRVEKHIRLLDNRLHRAQLNFSQALIVNRKRRETIDRMCKERIVNLAIRRQLECDLSKRRRKISKIIRRSEIINYDRENLMQEVIDRKHKGMRQVYEFEQRWLNVDTLLEKQSAEQLFEEAQDASRRFKESKGLDPSQQKMKAIETIVRRASWAIAKDMACIRVVITKVQEFSKLFGWMRNESNVDDIDELVERFTSAEKRNFEKFCEVNALSDGIEMIEYQLGDIEADIELAKEEKEFSKKHSRNEIINSVEYKIETNENTIDAYDRRIQDVITELNHTRPAMQKLVDLFRYDPEKPKLDVGEHNLMGCMSFLEKEAYKVLQLRQTQANKAALFTSEPFDITAGDGEAHMDFDIEIPSTLVDIADDGDEESDEEEGGNDIFESPFLTATSVLHAASQFRRTSSMAVNETHPVKTTPQQRNMHHRSMAASSSISSMPEEI